MPTRSQFRHEDVAVPPRGYRVRTITHPSGHRVRVAFPPGPRRRGAGRLVSILHPHAENPFYCVGRSKLEEFAGAPARRSFSEGGNGHNPASYRQYKGVKFGSFLMPDGKTWAYTVWANKKLGVPGVAYVAAFKRQPEAEDAARGWIEEQLSGPRNPARRKSKRNQEPLVCWNCQSEQIFAREDVTGHPRAGAGDFVCEQCGAAGDVEDFLASNPRRGKQMTREQVEKIQDRAVTGLRNLGEDDKADDVADLSVEEYAEKKKITLTNPKQRTGAWQDVEFRGIPKFARLPGGSLKGMPPSKKPKENPFHKDTQFRNLKYKGGIIQGEYSDDGKSWWPFEASEDLAKIGTAYYSDRAAAARIWSLQDGYGQPGYTPPQGHDWSGIRDSSPQAIRAMETVAERWAVRIGHKWPWEHLSNPDEGASAAALYEDFHGAPSKETLEFQQEILRRKDYAALGPLVELRGSGWGIEFTPQDQVLLASNAEGSQLYVIGGNQDVSALIEKAKLDATKDFLDLGALHVVTYRTRKHFDRFEESDYVHKMGEGGHAKPCLIYDKLNRQLYIVGGEYRVKDVGIVH